LGKKGLQGAIAIRDLKVHISFSICIELVLISGGYRFGLDLNEVDEAVTVAGHVA
jgi:hypothetical protein